VPAVQQKKGKYWMRVKVKIKILLKIEAKPNYASLVLQVIPEVFSLTDYQSLNKSDRIEVCFHV
jgi:hypothetical protein